MGEGDFKFITIAIIFISLLSLMGYYIAIDDASLNIDGTYNSTYTDSTNTNNLDQLKDVFSGFSTSGLLILSTLGTIFSAILVFVILRFIRGQ